MTTRLMAAALAALLSAFPVSLAFAQAENAPRIAMEVAIRRAQVRAALCEQNRLDPAALRDQRPTVVLPASPPTGTAGPVALPVDCPRR